MLCPAGSLTSLSRINKNLLSSPEKGASPGRWLCVTHTLNCAMIKDSFQIILNLFTAYLLLTEPLSKRIVKTISYTNGSDKLFGVWGVVEPKRWLSG